MLWLPLCQIKSLGDNMNVKTEERLNTMSSQLVLGADEGEKLFRIIFESNTDAVLVSDSEGIVRLTNCKAEQLFNLPAEKIIGHKMQFLCDSNGSREVNISRSGKDAGIAEVRSIEVKLSDGRPLHISTFRDITELVRLREEMRALTFVDDLVDLCNRRGFFLLAHQQLKLANRTKKGLCLLLITVDNYKQVNEKYGQQAGNRLLVQFAEILKDTFRTSDIIARISENMFAVLAVEAQVCSTDAMATHLLDKLEIYNAKVGSDSDRLLASMGTAYHYSESPAPSIDGLLQHAELQLYRQKRGKRQSALLWYLEQDNGSTTS